MQNAASIAQGRFGRSSIENTVGTTNNNSIEIPPAVDNLIDNKMYRNRYKKLIREGHLSRLLTLAAEAMKREKPSHWFAKVCSVRRWEGTLEWLAKLAEVRDVAERVARRIGVKVNGFIYKQVWRGANVERWAAVAEEAGKSRPKYFAWLCTHEAELDGTR